jgi:dihydroxy-acid dehydratase
VSGGTLSDVDLKHRSRALTEGPERAAARAYLKGIGFDDDALARPLIGVAHCWIETMPCNFNHRALAAKVKEGVRAAGGTPMELNTISISDGITDGHERHEDIARLARAHRRLDRARRARALCSTPGGALGLRQDDPGTVMALARLDIPGVMLYGGSIRPGRFEGHDVTIQDVFEAWAPTRPAA